MKIKICGIFRDCDADFLNEAEPDYAGFVFAPSKRRISPYDAVRLRDRIKPNIKTVGVFVNAVPEYEAHLANAGVISMIQLHGDELPEHIEQLRELCDVPIIRAVNLNKSSELPKTAADFYLLDGGSGQGIPFDWSNFRPPEKRWFLAGGINTDNIELAMAVSPYGIDVSSGAETGGVKDKEKIIRLCRAVREYEERKD